MYGRIKGLVNYDICSPIDFSLMHDDCCVVMYLGLCVCVYTHLLSLITTPSSLISLVLSDY